MQPLDQQRIEARGCYPSGRHHDNAANLVQLDAGHIESAASCGLDQVERTSNIGTVALGPTVRLVEPFEGHNRIAAGNAAIRVDRDQALEIRRATEELFDTRHDIALVEAVRWNGGRDRDK